ncbi:MAG: hypothetical protein KGO82_14470, partial [Bacteroidota bacterium]|nr:hypothetical protein [Bacteroidota bacterium]
MTTGMRHLKKTRKPMTEKRKTIARDISWLAFNARVLQEAGDSTV